MGVTGALAAGPTRILQYNLEEQILNRLAVYVYNGQSNELFGFAPWINPATINQNPVLGGGGDAVWYQVQYTGALSKVTVSVKGLPTDTAWNFTLGGKTFSNTTYNKSGKKAITGVIDIYSTAGTQSINPCTGASHTCPALPAGYGFVKVTGPVPRTPPLARPQSLRASRSR